MGASASDIRAGGAYYELSAKDGLTPVLTRARATAELFGRFLANLNPGGGGSGFFNRLIFGAKDVDARTGKFVGRVGGLVAPLRAIFSPGAGGSGLINRMLFGDKVTDAKSGEFLQRAGGLVAPLRTTFAPLAGVISRALFGDKADPTKAYANRAKGLVGSLMQVFGSGAQGSGLVNRWLFGDKRFDEAGKFKGRIGGIVPVALGAASAIRGVFSGGMSSVNSLAKGLGKVGLALGGIGAAGVSAFKPAFEAIGESGKIADLAEIFNISGEKASRLFGIMAAGGSDLRDAQEGLATFKQRINDALTGTGEEAKKLFQELGVGAESFAKLDTSDQFFKLIDAVKQSKSALGPLLLLMKAVGEDTGKNLRGTLSMTAEQLKALGDQFEQSSSDLQTARETTRAYALAVAGLGRVWREVGAAIAPALTALAGIGSEVLKPVVAWIKENKMLVAVTLAGAGALIAVGGAAVVAAVALAGTVAVVGALIAGWKVLLGILAIASGIAQMAALAAAVGGAVYAFAKYTETGRTLTAQIKAALAPAIERLKPAFEKAKEGFSAFANAIQKGDFAAAWEVVSTGAQAAWSGMLAALTQEWNAFTAPIEDSLDDVFGGPGEVLNVAWAEAKAAFAKIQRAIEWVGAVAQEVWTGIKDGFKQAVDYVSGLWEKFGPRIMQALEPIKPFLLGLAAPFIAAVAVIQAVWDALDRNILLTINNLGSGIEKIFARVGAAVQNSIKTALNFVLDKVIKVSETLAKIDPSGLLDEVAKAAGVAKDAVGTIGDRDGKTEVADIEKRRLVYEQKIRADIETAKGGRAKGNANDAKETDRAVADAMKNFDAAIARANAPGPAMPAFGGAPGNPIIPNVSVRGAFTSDMLTQQLGAGGPQQRSEGLLKELVIATTRNSPEAIGKAVTAAAAIMFTAGN